MNRINTPNSNSDDDSVRAGIAAIEESANVLKRAAEVLRGCDEAEVSKLLIQNGLDARILPVLRDFNLGKITEMEMVKRVVFAVGSPSEN